MARKRAAQPVPGGAARHGTSRSGARCPGTARDQSAGEAGRAAREGLKVRGVGTGRARRPVRKGGREGARPAGRVTQQPWHAHRNSSSALARHDAECVRPDCWGRWGAEARFPHARWTTNGERDTTVRPLGVGVRIPILSKPASSPSPGWAFYCNTGCGPDYKSHNATRRRGVSRRRANPGILNLGPLCCGLFCGWVWVACTVGGRLNAADFPKPSLRSFPRFFFFPNLNFFKLKRESLGPSWKQITFLEFCEY